MLFVGWVFGLLGGDSVVIVTSGGVVRLCPVCIGVSELLEYVFVLLCRVCSGKRRPPCFSVLASPFLTAGVVSPSYLTCYCFLVSWFWISDQDFFRFVGVVFLVYTNRFDPGLF